jgi:hypothetical protein
VIIRFYDELTQSRSRRNSGFPKCTSLGCRRRPSPTYAARSTRTNPHPMSRLIMRHGPNRPTGPRPCRRLVYRRCATAQPALCLLALGADARRARQRRAR